MTDRVFTEAGDWALGSDGIQWILMRRRTRKSGQFWNPVWFVRSHRDVLAMGMREKGVEVGTASFLLAGLPDTFEEWKSLLAAPGAPQAGSKEQE